MSTLNNSQIKIVFKTTSSFETDGQMCLIFDLSHPNLSLNLQNIFTHGTQYNACFFGFPGYKNENEIVKDILKQIKIINNYKPGYIRFDPFVSRVSPRELTWLRHHFEDLIGNIEMQNNFYSKASEKIKRTIDDLNFNLHELEILRNSIPRVTFKISEDEIKKINLESSIESNLMITQREFGDMYLTLPLTGTASPIEIFFGAAKTDEWYSQQSHESKTQYLVLARLNKKSFAEFADYDELVLKLSKRTAIESIEVL